MNKILTIKKAIKISKELKKQGKTIVLAGGCFDILHIGHIKFLEEARKKGDFLFVLLESDEKVKKLKGKGRPVNSQQDRASILTSLNQVDYIITLPWLKTDSKYEEVVMKIKPAIIAITKGDLYREQKERQAKLVKAKVISVIKRIPNKSTSRLAKLLSRKFYL